MNFLNMFNDTKIVTLDSFIEKHIEVREKVFTDIKYIEFDKLTTYGCPLGESSCDDTDSLYETKYTTVVETMDLLKQTLVSQLRLVGEAKGGSLQDKANNVIEKHSEMYGEGEFLVQIRPRHYIVADSRDFVVYVDKKGKHSAIVCTANRSSRMWRFE